MPKCTSHIWPLFSLEATFLTADTLVSASSDPLGGATVGVPRLLIECIPVCDGFSKFNVIKLSGVSAEYKVVAVEFNDDH